MKKLTLVKDVSPADIEKELQAVQATMNQNNENISPLYRVDEG